MKSYDSIKWCEQLTKEFQLTILRRARHLFVCIPTTNQTERQYVSLKGHKVKDNPSRISFSDYFSHSKTPDRGNIFKFSFSCLFSSNSVIHDNEDFEPSNIVVLLYK